NGSFPRFLSNFVRELQLMPFEEGIRRITSLPAETYGLKDRGVLRKNAYADIVVFDPVQLRDQATYQQPDLAPEGIQSVFINGQLTIEGGVFIGQRLGTFI
ncbi:aminoacylase, partial [bacterium]